MANERIQRHSKDRDEVFRLISENAADMIAVVDIDGKRLYNSPSYQFTLGYSPEELEQSGVFEQIHHEDREKVMRAAQRAQCEGVGTRLEYRIRQRKVRHRGVGKVNWMFTIACAAYNLVRMRNLAAAVPGA